MPLYTHGARGAIPTRDLCIFAALAAMLFLSRIGLQWIPGIHPMALIIAAMTLRYRVRALIPLYSYILLDGVFAGFSLWWIPYLYVWLPLWAVFMLAGKLDVSLKVKAPLYMVLCALHGLSFGVLYAPAQALMFGFSFRATVAWVIAGLPFDVVHAIGNFAAGTLVVPLTSLLTKLDRGQYRI